MDQAKVSLNDKYDENQTIGEKLLTPTKIYVKDINKLKKNVDIKAISHITGGGLYENIPRVLADNLSVEFDLSNLDIDPIFSKIQQWGNIDTEEMYNTFNMGIGMVVFVDPSDESKVLDLLKEDAKTIGKVVSGNKDIRIKY